MPRSERMNDLIQQERLSAHEQLLADNASARAMMSKLEKQVDKRIKAARAELDAFEEIARLSSELRRVGVEVPMLLQTIKRFDRSDREIKSITRQAFDNMTAKHEGRRPARTAAASRRRGSAEPGGGVNLDVLR